MVTLELTGVQIQEILEQSATNQRPPDPRAAVGGLVQTSGVQWTVDMTRAEGRRIRDVRVGADPLDPNRSYRIVTHSGMLAGIHRYRTFERGAKIERQETKVADVVENALRAMGRVMAPATGDIRIVPASQ